MRNRLSTTEQAQQDAKRQAPRPATPTPAETPATPTAAKAAPRLPSGPKPEKTPKPEGPCLCGCGSTAKKRFRQGHDARLKGALQRAHHGCSHPADTPLAKIAAVFAEAGLEPKAATPEALCDALGTGWFERFVLGWSGRPGARKAAAATETEEAVA